MKLIVGLGNPGREYSLTRHNVGWWVVDHLAELWHLDGWRRDGDAQVASGMLGNVKLRLMKPQTFMNLSGDALRPYLRRPFWAAQTDLLVISDDVALPVGRYRMRAKGSAGGHNGLKSIEHNVKTQDYARLRVGVGPPADRALSGDLVNYVLGACSRTERDEIVDLIPSLASACELWLRGDVEAAMRLNN
ncbi:MAG: aminoacyl-tRNA hydrolase [Gemmatimonadaceae bacterium]